MNNEYRTILAGFGKMDVTPFAPVHLGSYNNGMQRLSNRQKPNDPFQAITLALTDEDGQTLLFIVTDLSWGHITWTKKIRELVQERYGIPGEHVLLGGTHNHTGPDWYSEALDTLANRAYFDHWLSGVMSSVYIALQDRKPSKIRIGTTEAKGLTFVRRYLCNDGSLVGVGNPINQEFDIACHETQADEQVQLVRFVREEGKDILLCQWQSHGDHLGGIKTCTTNWIGPMRRRIEAELGCSCIYMQGCAGNLVTSSRIKAEYKKKNEDEVGELVAAAVVDAYRRESTFRGVNGGKIRAIQQTFVGYDYEGDDWEGELNTVSFGDVSLVSFPVEMFDTSGMQIKAQTPFEMTVLMDYACGIHGYCPDEKAYANGGYETRSRGGCGTAEQIVKAHLDALRRLHEV